MKQSRNTEKSKKILTIVELSVLGVFLLGFALCLISQLAAPESDLAVWIKDNVWDVNAFIQSFKEQIPEIIQSLIYIVLVYAV
ncbi:MAG: hypothetical protein J6B04_03845, partial [Clostridia bacterium]|nr:hypothetical protein [Clostridia bacterium]